MPFNLIKNRMRKIFFILLSICLPVSFLFAGGSHWPGVKYSYAMVYLYNVDGNLHGFHQILKEGKLDKSVQGEGKKLSGDQASKLEKIFASGPAIDELVNGLSGCYIPRHAIVYYNEKDEPVASMSVCFECEGIRFYSPSYPRNHYASSEKLIKEAETKLTEIKAIIESLGFKTDYKMSLDPPAENNGSMTITDGAFLDSLLPAKVSFGNRTDYFTDEENLKTIYDEKYTYGGEKFIFVEVYKGKSKLFFSGPDENASLENARVVDNDVKLLKKIKIGMTTEELMGLFILYDGISNPSEITVQNQDQTQKVTFKFTENKLVEYYLEVRVW
jgi:hypothetical protein